MREAVKHMSGEAAGGRSETPRWIPPRGWTGEGEVFAAGFLHRDRYDDVPAGAGFAAGGFMDELPVGLAAGRAGQRIHRCDRGRQHHRASRGGGRAR